MEEVVLGKITKAEYGQSPNYQCMFGIHLSFEFPSGGIADGEKYLLNISPDFKWEDEDEKNRMFMVQQEEINKVLTDAKVNYVSQLVNKPVEITINNRFFKKFRILTEVV
ncbi:hypothetical protein [Rossellomorea marisflavi]|uniref:hypothetical protein n=1 Tax=Rossellomorea marisflavi TaxID=189381 RepID=UPI003FA03C23